ncbi:acetyl-CoA carboxylase biotin carboxylase subunit [bacterium]|nr:acetyl-CoA carboxylase biotin carboxylase subunit [bacterium]
MFNKVLIANRGEIAVRVIRACREMGVKSVAVYSEVDRTSLHVLLADEAYPIGPAPASESYLVAEKIIDVAKRSGAEAIHPGYGFLSENAHFARAVRGADLTWIGPPPDAIATMGSKTEARSIMMKAGVPVVPGTPEGIRDLDEATRYAEEIGYPVLIKAAMGGGGKGMRVVHEPSELKESLDSARRESESAFSSPIVFLEKYLEKPRHIEFQVFADNHGNIIHLGERECSIQRRHQKVVEEAPSPLMTPELREEMGRSAVEAARACGYQNAGTVEFLVDQNRNHYFLEMNTRLQVEHPVTEMVTGLDLVRLQLLIASGEKLPYSQEDIKLNGHAIEMRIYSEDSMENFLPSTGKIRYLKPPDGFGIREDAGIREGDSISIFYDPMISKLVAWGQDREIAIRRMRRALMEYRITGVRTTIPFGIFVMENAAFREGNFDTSFVQEEFDVERLVERSKEREMMVALAAAWHHKQGQSISSNNHSESTTQPGINGMQSGWRKIGRKANLR